MTLSENLAEELKVESAKTRSLLAIVPDAHLSWRPHEKSMTLGKLASHLVDIPNWEEPTINLEELDAEGFKPFLASGREEMLRVFDANLAKALKCLGGRSDQHLAVLWRFKRGGRALLEMPRSAVIRYLVLNHTVHHRGQLTVYLRLKEVPLPSIYGPTADSPVPS